MATNWAFQSAASKQIAAQATPTVAVSPTPLAGALMVAFWGAHRATTAFTSAAIADTGSGGWATVGPFQTTGAITTQSWWKVATAADAAATVTVTPTGGSSTISQDLEVDVFLLPPGFGGIALDLASNVVNASGTTKSWSPASGSGSPSFTDALAVTGNYGFGSRGVPTGTNTFTGTSSAAALAITNTAAQTLFLQQYVGGVQASATAGTNVWENTWTTTNTALLVGATFIYKSPSPADMFAVL